MRVFKAEVVEWSPSAARKRIADLEAERKKLRGWLTATEKALTESQIRAEKAEAELASVRDGLPESVKRGKWVVYCRNQFKAYDRAYRSEQEWRSRAEKAEAEVERLKQHPHLWVDFIDGSGTFCFFCHRLKERGGRKSLSSGKASGKTTGTSPSGVSPSPPLLPDAKNCIHGVCSGTWLRVSDNVELPCPCRRCHPSAAEPAAPRVPLDAEPIRKARKKLAEALDAARKERDG